MLVVVVRSCLEALATEQITATVDIIIVDNYLKVVSGAKTVTGCSEREAAVENTCFSLAIRAFRTRKCLKTGADES